MSETIKISQMEVIDAASGEMMFEVSIKKNHVWHTRSVSADQLKDWLDGEFELGELGTASKKDIEFFLQSANNLSDLVSVEDARLNLGLGSAATEDSAKFLQTENNLSDLDDAEEARLNLGLGSGATSDADDFMRKDSNLSDVASVSQARGNLGLGSAATRDASDFATAAQGARADGAIPAIEKGAPTGVATLNAQGKLRAEQVPRLAISEPFVVSSEQEMLALDVQVGDVAIRTDSSETFILQQEPAGDIANWIEVLTPPSGVVTFNGRSGTVEPSDGDYSADQISFGSGSVADELERLETDKVDKIQGKGLSTNDFDNNAKQKLENIDPEANKTEVVQGVGGSETAVMSQKATTEALDDAVGQAVDAAIKAPAIIDGLRRSVEAASGGVMTVHYTAKGQASYFFVQGAFIARDADTGLPNDIHPMFRIGGNDVKERFIGAFQGRIVNGELLSLPGVDPSVSTNFDSFVNAARACGPGFGLMTNADWAGIGAWCRANDFYPRGNSDYGRDRHNPFETGVIQNGPRPGENAGSDRVLTGSGPASWRHNNDMIGISDLCGNVWEWAPGLRLVDGEIHVIADNDSALNATDLSAGSSAWKAIDAATGALVNPGSSGVVSLAASGSANGTIVVASGGNVKAMTSHGVSADALQMLKLHGMFPLGSDIGDDRISFTLEGERVPIRGGGWSPGYRSGVFTVSMGSARSSSNTDVGARPAFYL